MRIPKAKIDEIFRRADIVEVIGEYVQLKKKGHYFSGLSPFKSENTPSFTVTPAKQIYKDFSTGKGGNVVSFLMEVDGLSYPQALLYLAKKYQIDIEFEEDEDNMQEQQKAESLKILNKFAAEYYLENLFETDNDSLKALNYLTKRGFDENIIKLFQIGYCLPKWNVFSEFALKKQFSEELLIESGNSIKSEKTQKLIDRFHGRITFPIHDFNGKIIGFSARIIEKNTNLAKYVNSPESIIYKKGEVLFGLFFAKQFIRDADECILVEGNADFISLYQYSIRNVVATSGTAITVSQIKLIKRFTNKVLLIFDSDRAGINAALRGIDLMLSESLSVRVLLLPDGHDPDSFVREQGEKGFKEYCRENSKDFLSFKQQALELKLSPSDPSHKAELVREIVSSISFIPDEIERNVFIGNAAERFNLEPQILFNYLQKILDQKKRRKDYSTLEIVEEFFDTSSTQTEFFGTTSHSGKNQDSPGPAAGPPSKTNFFANSENSEWELLRIMANNFGRILYEWNDGDDFPSDSILLYQFFYQEIGQTPFKNPVLEVIREKLFESYLNDAPSPIEILRNEYDVEVKQAMDILLNVKYTLSTKWQENDLSVPKIDYNLSESVLNGLRHFKLKKLNEMISENSNMIHLTQNKPESTVEIIEKLLKRKIHLEKIRKEITTELGIVIL